MCITLLQITLTKYCACTLVTFLSKEMQTQVCTGKKIVVDFAYYGLLVIHICLGEFLNVQPIGLCTRY